MISMQRSLSSPVRIHASPPVSPTITQTSSRSPTPSPDDHAGIHERSRGLETQGLSVKPDNTASLTFRRSVDLSRRPSTRHSSSSTPTRKPIIAQATAQPPTPPPVATRDRSESLESGSFAELPDTPPVHDRPQPLLRDVSMYTNPQMAPDVESTTLEELAHLVRLARYQERKRANTRIRLQRSLISTALSARLARCGELAYRNLADGFRGDDKKAFASLYNAVNNVRKSCDELRKFALMEPETDNLRSPGTESSENLSTPTIPGAASAATGSIVPFLCDISASAREAFLDFLSQLRNNPDYLATRLSALNHSELGALTTFHQGLEPIETVLPFHNRPTGRGSGANANRNTTQSSNTVERLLSFQRHDPLSALIHTCFANSAGPDSAEDRRRTVIWATACARLMSEPKIGHEAFNISVLNAWAAMRDWSGRAKMEWYLMKILEDGAFLLDRAEDQHGTRFNLSDWTQKDQIAAEDFYERATDELFEVIDDEDATGVPEGLLELGNEILIRLDKKLVDTTRKWFVYKWLFSVWLVGVIVHPESYGLMTEYHITEYGRQKILKTVAMRAMVHVGDMLNKPGPVSIPPKVKAHVENILYRFKGSRSRRYNTRLLPARSITSLRETAEVHPYLVLSPADLVTLVNALFPERRPQSAQSGSLRSTAYSVSGFSAISQPISVANSRNFETGSVLSTSASSSFSEATTSREPLLEEQHTGASQRSSPPLQNLASRRQQNHYEDDGYRLRLAVHHMTQTLGSDVVRGAGHPCAERWAVLFISADGNGLSTQMTYDPDDDADEDENSSTSDTDGDDVDDDRPELDKDYHQLRDSILKLVEDYEIPQNLENDGNKAQTFSNRATSLKKYRLKNKIITTERPVMESRNPYRRQSAAESVASSSNLRSSAYVYGKGKSPEQPEDLADNHEPVLVTMLEAASSQSRAQSDFVSAHLYWRTLQQLNALTSNSLRRDGFAILLNIFSRGPRDSIRRSASAIEEYDAWLVWLKQSQERAEGLLDSMTRRIRALRDKMWYVTDVRNSAPYEATRNVAAALKTMGMPRRWNNVQRTRHTFGRSSTASYLFRTESQIMETMAATEEQGGPNKLSDEQAEKTLSWLRHYSIERNFCRGEERIHRFCCEIDDCVNKLVGENLVDSPVLWSSDLYVRDRRGFETARGRDRDNQGWDDTASVMSDRDRRYTSSSRPNSIARDLRSMSTHNTSQHSIDSARFSFSRASTVLTDVFDGHDYFGASSPVTTIDTSTTFWSPFHPPMSPGSSISRAQSPTTGITNMSGSFTPSTQYQMHSSNPYASIGRPSTSASSSETVFQQRLSDEKVRFLKELRQTLTSLLLSDLGNLVFARGSETDLWFETLGQECIERRDMLNKRYQPSIKDKERRKANRHSLKQRTLEKKKSFGDLRGSTSELPSPDTVETHSQSTETLGLRGNDSSTATSDTPTTRIQPSRKPSIPDFPFTKAYQRLLRMFCVHPNPYVKLNSLFELEHLIVASLSSSGSRRRAAWLARVDNGTSDDHAAASSGRSKPLEEAIDNVKERRSHIIAQSAALSPGLAGGRGAGMNMNAETRSVVSVNPANTDAITNVLQSLFRDQSIRPKTLFRDLQYIAAFVPPSVLDSPDRGRAFWNVGLAALSLKEEVCKTMVEVADEVVASHTQPLRGRASFDSTATSSTAEGGGGMYAPPIITHGLADAARMWAITAKEGDSTSQRELALFYLSNPELVERTTLPLCKPSAVFKQTVMEKYGGWSSSSGGGSGRHHGHHHHSSSGGGAVGSGSGMLGSGGGAGLSGAGVGGGGGGSAGDAGPAGGGAGKTGGDVRSDPGLMCVAIHWMEAAEQGGDELARTFLGQNEMGG